MLHSDIVREDVAQIVTACRHPLQRLAGKTILITGAAGFLPAYLVYALVHANQTLNLNLHLVLLTRSPVSSRSRLFALSHEACVTFVIQDVSVPLQLDRPIHYIIHAASRAFPQSYLADPLDTINANSLALRHLLEIAKQQTVESFLYFSSSEVYGSPTSENVPTPESYPGCVDFTGERSCYAEAKRFGETMCMAYFRQHQVPVKIVRPFHTYGPGMSDDDSRLIPLMIRRALAGGSLDLLGDGRATRTYAYIVDATIGFLKVFLSDHNGHAFNVGADEPELPVVDVVRMIATLVDPSQTVSTQADESAKELQQAPNRVCPDLTKLRTMLQYVPETTLKDGLQRTIEWYQHKE